MRSRFAVLRHRDFRLLWLALGGSVLGDMIVLTALALYVTDLTGDPTDLGIVLTAQSAPLVVFLLIGGVVADRMPRHRVLLATDVVRAVVQASLAVLVLLDATQIWHLVIAGVLFGTAEAFARPASTGLVPQTVPDGEVQEARALVSMTQNIAEIGGPALGTALVVGLSAGFAFAADAATFLVSALLLVRVRPRDRSGDRAAAMAAPAGPELAVAEGLPAASDWRVELREGWHEVRSRSWVWATVAGATAGLLLALAPLFVLGPTVAEEEYGSVGYYGLVMTAFGAGAVVGAVTGMRWRPRHPLRAAHLVVAPWPLIGVLMGLGTPLWIVVPLAVVAGWGISLFDVWWNTAMAERIPPQSLSRVSAFDWMGSLALLPIGYALSGPVAEAIGTTELLVGGGVLAIAASLAVLLSRGVRDLERLETPGVAPEPAAPLAGQRA